MNSIWMCVCVHIVDGWRNLHRCADVHSYVEYLSLNTIGCARFIRLLRMLGLPFTLFMCREWLPNNIQMIMFCFVLLLAQSTIHTGFRWIHPKWTACSESKSILLYSWQLPMLMTYAFKWEKEIPIFIIHLVCSLPVRFELFESR